MSAGEGSPLVPSAVLRRGRDTADRRPEAGLIRRRGRAVDTAPAWLSPPPHPHHGAVRASFLSPNGPHGQRDRGSHDAPAPCPFPPAAQMDSAGHEPESCGHTDIIAGLFLQCLRGDMFHQRDGNSLRGHIDYKSFCVSVVTFALVAGVWLLIKLNGAVSGG